MRCLQDPDLVAAPSFPTCIIVSGTQTALTLAVQLSPAQLHRIPSPTPISTNTSPDPFPHKPNSLHSYLTQFPYQSTMSTRKRKQETEEELVELPEDDDEEEEE